MKIVSIDEKELRAFVKESNKIEKILRSPTKAELEITKDFLSLPFIRLGDLENFVRVCAPGAPMRLRSDMNVTVGDHRPPRGGPQVKEELQKILDRANNGDDPHLIHVAYETLHPFMDGNGRSGRALWAWQMLQQEKWPGIKLGFLHPFYYQSLSHARSK